MSILKAELKQLVTHEVGVRVDDALESAKRDLHSLEGRQAAFMDGAKAVELLLGHVDKDVTEERYGLEVATEVKKYLVRAANVLQNLSRESMNMMLAQTGKVQAFHHTVSLLKGMIDAEKEKLAKLVTEAAPPTPAAEQVRAPTGEEGRPPMSIKALRLAEEAAEQPAEKPAAKRGRRAKNA